MLIHNVHLWVWMNQDRVLWILLSGIFVSLLEKYLYQKSCKQNTKLKHIDTHLWFNTNEFCFCSSSLTPRSEEGRKAITLGSQQLVHKWCLSTSSHPHHFYQPIYKKNQKPKTRQRIGTASKSSQREIPEWLPKFQNKKQKPS